MGVAYAPRTPLLSAILAPCGSFLALIPIGRQRRGIWGLTVAHGSKLGDLNAALERPLGRGLKIIKLSTIFSFMPESLLSQQTENTKLARCSAKWL